MSQFKIDKRVPLPPKLKNGGGHCKYPWHEMKVGDSFFVFMDRNAMSAGAAYHSKGKKKYATRRDGNGTRVWRVK